MRTALALAVAFVLLAACAGTSGRALAPGAVIDAVKAVNRSVDEAKASGLVAGAISRAGLSGVDVAP